MVKKYRGREWRWWVVMCTQVCRFCYMENYPHGREAAGLGKQTGGCWLDKDFRRKLYQIWLKHMKQYHPEILMETSLLSTIKLKEKGMLDHKAISKHFTVHYTNSYTDISIKALGCKYCDFCVWRQDVTSRRGCHVKYGGMRAKMIKHIHTEHPEIWEQCQAEPGEPHQQVDPGLCVVNGQYARRNFPAEDY